MAGSYGSYGNGYHYNNGLMTGLIIGGMMHPYGTVMYVGPGMYGGNAFLYPNGQVVNGQGILVGTYINNVFSPVANGGMVAQQVPADAYQQEQQPAPQTVVVQKEDPFVEFLELMGVIAILILAAFLMFLFFGVL
jgi:hypothetical protein